MQLSRRNRFTDPGLAFHLAHSSRPSLDPRGGSVLVQDAAVDGLHDDVLCVGFMSSQYKLND